MKETPTITTISNTYRSSTCYHFYYQVRKRAQQLKHRQKWEKEERDRITAEQESFLEQAAHNYMKCLESSDAHDIEIFRVGLAFFLQCRLCVFL